MAAKWLSAPEAAARLGVKTETLYAYVSRDLIRSERLPGDRRSRYLREDVERLAARQRGGGGRAGGLEIIVETEITYIDPSGHLLYRGRPVEEAARGTFEQVAGWLWSATDEPVRFAGDRRLIAAGRAAIRRLRKAPTIDQLRVAVAAMRPADPLRDDRRLAAVARTGALIIGSALDALAETAATAPPDASAARRLWPIVSSVAPTDRSLRVLDTALVALADHELAASTLAARVAASTWADPYLVVEAGLATLGGPLHGGASETGRRLLREIYRGGRPAIDVIGELLRSGQSLPGFGHSVYETGDPRSRVILDALPRRGSPVIVASNAVREAAKELDLPPPNVDFALATMAEHFEMTTGSVEVTFAIARIVGWLAHATEEYRHRLRFRPRAIYTGPR